MARVDALFVALAGLHGAAVLAAPSAPLIALGIWWNSNTIAHNFIHHPFFRWRWANLLFSAGQSLLMGIPQALWRDRHLAHHAGVHWRMRWTPQLLMETTLAAALWVVLATLNPQFFLMIYLPGYVAGLALCAMQGHYEHKTATTSYYGRIYNALCFNDGYHVEHHKYPGMRWTELPRRIAAEARVSAWPPLLRWLDALSLESLERLVLRWPSLQRFVLHVHRNAFRTLLAELPCLRRIAIVGGGLFPRTAMVLRELIPDAQLVVIDVSQRNVDTARLLIGDTVTFEHARYTPADSRDFDLIVIPLAFQGDRSAIYQRPPARAVLVHDWLWRRRGSSCLVSVMLLKRLNLVRA